MALPVQQAAGACLGPRPGEGGFEGLGHRHLKCLMLEKVLVDRVRRPSAMYLDVF